MDRLDRKFESLNLNEKLDSFKPDTEKLVRNVKRTAKASVRKVKPKRAPKLMILVGLVALTFASLYLMKVFDSFSTIPYDGGFEKTLSLIVVLFLFVQYIMYVITIFKLSSGMRSAWAAMVRYSGLYVLLMLLSYTHIFDFLTFDLVAFKDNILLIAMLAVTLFMFWKPVREFYTPGYEEVAPMKSWILLVFWVDPYGTDADLTIDVDVPT